MISMILFNNNHLFAHMISCFLSNKNNFPKRSIWLIDGTLTDTTNPGQSGTGSNGNERIVDTP